MFKLELLLCLKGKVIFDLNFKLTVSQALKSKISDRKHTNDIYTSGPILVNLFMINLNLY
jgi:hypothetical protein